MEFRKAPNGPLIVIPTTFIFFLLAPAHKDIISLHITHNILLLQILVEGTFPILSSKKKPLVPKKCCKNKKQLSFQEPFLDFLMFPSSQEWGFSGALFVSVFAKETKSSGKKIAYESISIEGRSTNVILKEIAVRIFNCKVTSRWEAPLICLPSDCLYFLFLINWQERQSHFSLRPNVALTRKEKRGFLYYSRAHHLFSRVPEWPAFMLESQPWCTEGRRPLDRKHLMSCGAAWLKLPGLWKYAWRADSDGRLGLLGVTDRKWPTYAGKAVHMQK